MPTLSLPGRLGLTVTAGLLAGTAGADTLRFATFNASLNRNAAGALVTDLAGPGNAQAQAVAEIIQRVDPDILLINEFDYDAGGVAAQSFIDNYLSVPQNGSGAGNPSSSALKHFFVAPSNTGVASGKDLDNSGAAGDFAPNDAQGFGFYEGQYGMAVFSKHAIDKSKVRTFQNFLWKDMPGALLPADPLDADGNGDTANWYTPDELDVLRLSSKSHWDVPIEVDGETVHFLVSHPTPPVFDGPEDRNGTRNHDEIRFWADYIAGESYFYDDTGGTGGLPDGARFVIAGDQNADPFDGDSVAGAANALLDSPLVQGSATDPGVTPASPGGTEQAAAQGGANDSHVGNPAFDTGDFGDGAPGNLRVDYVLPSKAGLVLTDTGVFWPEQGDPLSALTGTFPFPSSDHRLVYADLQIAPIPLPGALMLLSGGLLSLAGLSRLRRG